MAGSQKVGYNKIMFLKGVIIRKTETGEHNQLVTVYTEELGKIRVLAKSANKNTSKQAGHLDLFNAVDFLAVSGKNYPIITQAQSLENFLEIKSTFVKIMAGFFVLESFHRLVYEQEQDTALWNFLIAQLRKLELVAAEKSIVDAWLTDFKTELLEVLGYRRSLGKEEVDYFLQSLSAQNFLSLHLR